MKLYIDITQFINQRLLTGIQRVVKEFITISLKKNDFELVILFCKNRTFSQIDAKELLDFFSNIETYELKKNQKLNLLEDPSTNKIFFDIDSPWNALYKREELYPILKQNNYKIVNLIYDLIPILYPAYIKDITVKNFPAYLNTVSKYSDLILFNSQSAKKDFYTYNKNSTIINSIIPLGSNIKNTPILDAYFKYENIIQKKYILFVATLEPRKNHSLVIDAFDILSSKYKDLNLIFIGKKGWKNSLLINKINNHPLLNTRLFWFQNISDKELYSFYTNAFLVTYLSLYEGFGLPICESLSFGNITISSKNSSLLEVGKDFVDYIDNDDLIELETLISVYYTNTYHYKTKKEFIKNNYNSRTWDNVYNDLRKVFTPVFLK